MKYQLVFFATFFLFFVACKTEKETGSTKSTSEMATDLTLSMADIAGTYHGILPCASCPGIDTKIQLSEDGSFLIQQTYLDEDKTDTTRGTYKYSQSDHVIQLNIENEVSDYHQYTFKNDRIVKLSKNGKPIKGELAEMYELRKIANKKLLLDRYWKLTMVNGKSITQKQMPQKEAHLIFNEDETLSGNTGCNALNAKYQVTSDGKIEISNIFRTKMACAKIDYEADLILALHAATSYRITDSVMLIFNDSQNQRLKFIETKKPIGF